METEDEVKTSPAENVVRKACIWHASVVAETTAKAARTGGISKAVSRREKCAKDLAEAVEKYNKASR